MSYPLIYHLIVTEAVAQIPDGNLNGDTRLDSADALLLERFIADDLEPSETQRIRGDIAPLEGSPDGALTSGDVVLLFRAVAGEDVDGDTLSASAELALGISPFRRDSDRDGLADNAETGGLNPASVDTDMDGLPDGEDPAPLVADGGSLAWVHADRLGSPAVLSDSAGNVVRRISYGVWGEIRSNTSSGGNGIGHDPGEKFTGQHFDKSTGAHYYGARYVETQLGRFQSPDAFVPAVYDPQSLNRYAYVRNDPLNATDPTGNWPCGDDVCPGAPPSWDYEAGFHANAGEGSYAYSPTYDAHTPSGFAGGGGGQAVPQFVAPPLLPPAQAQASASPGQTALVDSGAQEPGFNPFFAAGVAATASGFAAGIGEVSNVQYGQWRSANPLKDGSRPFYDTRFHGNQYTGGRNAVLARGGAYALAGRVLFGVGAALSIGDAYQGNISREQAAMDVFMSGVGTFGGPIGLAAAGAYFGSQYAVQLFGLDPAALRCGSYDLI